MSAVLTKAQQYYIRGNMEVLTPLQIAADLGITVAIVTDYIASVGRDDGVSRTNALFQRPASGVVAMTEGASMAADDIRNRGLITQAEINRASAAGDYELAARLVRQRDEQAQDAETQQRAKYGHCVHFIRGPRYRPTTDRDRRR
jgi:hypothetical protein